MIIVALCCILLVLVLLLIASNFFFNFALRSNFKKGLNPTEGVAFDTEALSLLYGTSEEKEFFFSNAAECQCISHDNLTLSGYILEAPKAHRFAILCHGYTGSPREMVTSALHFYQKGYSVLLPEARAHGKSEGNIRGMGWLERKDILNWISFLLEKDKDCEVVLFGMSMGAATVMMTAGENLSPQVKAVIEDCGYTSVWDEFKTQMKHMFHLPAFPILHLCSLICRIRGGYGFKEASALEQVKKCRLPMLFIHGTDDTFVPYGFQGALYEAAAGPKEKYSVAGASHCTSLSKDPRGYWMQVDSFLEKYLSPGK